MCTFDAHKPNADFIVLNDLRCCKINGKKIYAINWTEPICKKSLKFVWNNAILMSAGACLLTIVSSVSSLKWTNAWCTFNLHKSINSNIISSVHLRIYKHFKVFAKQQHWQKADEWVRNTVLIYDPFISKWNMIVLVSCYSCPTYQLIIEHLSDLCHVHLDRSNWYYDIWVAIFSIWAFDTSRKWFIWSQIFIWNVIETTLLFVCNCVWVMWLFFWKNVQFGHFSSTFREK